MIYRRISGAMKIWGSLIRCAIFQRIAHGVLAVSVVKDIPSFDDFLFRSGGFFSQLSCWSYPFRCTIYNFYPHYTSLPHLLFSLDPFVGASSILFCLFCMA
jgi:hypothetical protein